MDISLVTFPEHALIEERRKHWVEGLSAHGIAGSALNCRVFCVGFWYLRGKPILQAMVVWKKTRDFGCQRLGRVPARKQQCSR